MLFFSHDLILFIFQCKIAAITLWDKSVHPDEFFDLCILFIFFHNRCYPELGRCGFSNPGIPPANPGIQNKLLPLYFHGALLIIKE